METQKMMNTEAIAPIVIAVAAKMIGDGVCDKIDKAQLCFSVHRHSFQT